nr:hypothetical protein [Variovorax boronicumulans]
MTDITDNIPGLKIEANEDGTLTLEQDWLGNVDRVAIHPIHVRHLAERLGMVREVSASDAELLRTEREQVASLRQENDRLKRQHLRLREHMLSLQFDFAEHADHRHADLTTEMWRINAVVDLMDLVCSDFADDYTAHVPSENPQVTQAEPSGFRARPETDPKLGAFETTPILGVLGTAPADAAGRRSCTPQEMHPHPRTPTQLQLEG